MTGSAAVPMVLLLAPPLLAALLAPAGAARPRLASGVHALLALTPVVAAVWLAALVVGGAVPTWGPGEHCEQRRGERGGEQQKDQCFNRVNCSTSIVSNVS